MKLSKSLLNDSKYPNPFKYETQFGFEVNEECIQGLDARTLVECLCLVSHNGTCPFGD